MPRQKVKDIPFSNKATETKPGSGVFRFKTGTTEWEYDSTRYGPNTGPVDNGVAVFQMYFKTLNEAACFAEGYVAGKGAIAKGARTV